MIDEFQYAPDGGQKLKLIYDTMKQIKIIITGSSSLDIKAHVGKYMVGRMLSFHLYPFNFGELLQVKNQRLERIYRENNERVIHWFFEGKLEKRKSGQDIFFPELGRIYEAYSIWGGYPAIVLTENETERMKILSEIYNNYILKDINTLLELATENKLYRLSQVLATQIGNIVTYNHLSQAAELDYRNLKKYLHILDETFIGQGLKPFFRNRQKELVKNPKFYFLDLGFRNGLIENVNNLEKRSDAGAMIENAVFIRLNELFSSGAKLNFWRTKAGAEVDFILQLKGKIIPIEVKYFPFESEKISKSLASFIDEFHPEYALVLTKNYWGFLNKNQTQILFIPVYYI